MRRTTSRITLTTAMALGLTALATTAGAQPRLALPEGATTDRFSADPWAASLDLGFSNYDGDNDILLATRIDLYGQFLGDVGVHRAGGYFQLPYARIEPEGEGDSFSKFGHLELGPLFATPIGATTDVVLRGGFAFEIEDDESEGFDSLAMILTGFGRLSEVFVSVTETNWARLSGSLLHRSHPYFGRVDLGVDIPFSDGEDDPFFRLNLAGGIDLESVALLAELSTLAVFLEDEDDEDEVLSTLAFTARIPAGTFSPVVSVVIPLDDEIQEIVDFVVVVGVRASGGVGN
jgi:hypothetical protein